MTARNLYTVDKPNFLYLVVSADRLELPLCVSHYIAEIAEFCGQCLVSPGLRRVKREINWNRAPH